MSTLISAVCPAQVLIECSGKDARHSTFMMSNDSQYREVLNGPLDSFGIHAYFYIEYKMPKGHSKAGAFGVISDLTTDLAKAAATRLRIVEKSEIVIELKNPNQFEKTFQCFTRSP